MIDDARNRLAGRPVPDPGPSGRPASSSGDEVAVRPRPRRRYRYWHRHTPHYYIVLTAISLALAVCALESLACAYHSIRLSELAFAFVAMTELFVSLAFFWGFYMAMSGNIPSHRLKYLIPHGAVGVLSPLLYMLNVCLGLDGLGETAVSVWSPVTSGVCLLLLGIQFSMGKAVVHRQPLHIVRSPPSTL